MFTVGDSRKSLYIIRCR